VCSVDEDPEPVPVKDMFTIGQAKKFDSVKVPTKKATDGSDRDGTPTKKSSTQKGGPKTPGSKAARDKSPEKKPKTPRTKSPGRYSRTHHKINPEIEETEMLEFGKIRVAPLDDIVELRRALESH